MISTAAALRPPRPRAWDWAYSQTLLCITNFGSSRWAWECMEFFVQNPLDLAQDWLERKSIENADAVLCHSRHMAAWLATHRYELPAATYVQPSIVPFAASHDGPCGRTQTAIREIVFFGRQEVRKGMRIWVDAVRILAAANPELRFTILVSSARSSSSIPAATCCRGFMTSQMISPSWPI